MKAVIFGASGGLASALGQKLLEAGWHLDLVTREVRRDALHRRFEPALADGTARCLTVADSYLEFQTQDSYDAHYFPQALFKMAPLAELELDHIRAEIEIGLLSHIQMTQKLLSGLRASDGSRRDFCFIGSTSAYAGFRNTAVYCAVKHGLLGFVRAMNDEYYESNFRFWLFSMGPMNTAMGAKVTGQDPASFLEPDEIAARIVRATTSPSNIFEPEMILRRRSARAVKL